MRTNQTKQQKKFALFFRRTIALINCLLFTVSSSSAYAAQPEGWVGANAQTNAADSRRMLRHEARMNRIEARQDRVDAHELKRTADRTLRIQPIGSPVVLPVLAPLDLRAERLERREARREAKQERREQRVQIRQNGGPVLQIPENNGGGLSASGRHANGRLGTLHIRNGVFQELANGRSLRLENGKLLLIVWVLLSFTSLSFCSDYQPGMHIPMTRRC